MSKLLFTTFLFFSSLSHGIESQKVRPRTLSNSNFTTYGQVNNEDFYNKLNYSFHWSFVKNPIEFGGVETAERFDRILENVHLLNFNVSYNLNKTFALAADVSATYLQKFEDVTGEVPDQEFLYINDIHLKGVWTFYRSSNSNTLYALSPRLLVPTGDEDLLLGEESLTPGLDLLAQWSRGDEKLKRHMFLGRLGYTHRQKETLFNLEIGPSVDLSFGHRWMFNKKKRRSFSSEIIAEVPVSREISSVNLPVEILVGFKDENQKHGSWSILFGKGMNSGYGSPDWRVSLGLGFRGLRVGRHKDYSAESDIIPVVEPKISQEEMLEKKDSLETDLLDIRGINFESSKGVITPNSYKILEKAKKTLIENNDLISAVKISGHTDSQGRAEFNQSLSEKRARAVMEYFQNDENLSSIKFTSIGYGESQPLVEEVDAESRRKNRRVELKLEMKND